MRITIVFRYFAPEAVLVNDIARWLAEAGHDVQVITAQPGYNPEAGIARQPSREVWNGVKIRRVRLLPEHKRGLIRHLNGVLFFVMASLMVLFGAKRDVVWTTSIPPVFQPFCLRVTSRLRGARFIYFLQDIYPEIALSMEMLRDGAIARLARRIDSWCMNASDVLVTLSEDMVRTVEARGVPRSKVVTINNFSMTEPRPLPSTPDDGPCRFVFAGNIGRFQELERGVDLFGRIDPSVAVLELLGEGRVKESLQRQVAVGAIRNVRFHDVLPVGPAFDYISRCDVGVVSLKPDLYKYAYPSKTFTYLAAGLPLLCFIEDESELGREIGRRRIGEAIDWARPEQEMVDMIVRLARDHASLRQGLRERAQDMFDPQVARRKWIGLFESMAADPQSRSPTPVAQGRS